MLRIIIVLVLVLSSIACRSGMDHEEALLLAAESGELPTIEHLLETGAKVDTRDDCLFTPLMQAALNGHFQAVERLLLFGAETEAADKSGYTALLLASQNGYQGIVERLLEAGANVAHEEHSNGWDALILAARHGNIELVELLMMAGADPGHRDHQGLTALHWAARLGHEPVVLKLLPEMKSESPNS